MFLFVCIVVLIAVFLYKRYQFAEQVNRLPGLQSLFGTGIGFIIHAFHFWWKNKDKITPPVLFLRLCNTLGRDTPDGIFSIWFGPLPIVTVTSPEMAEVILSSSSEINKSVFYKFSQAWVKDGLIATNRRWKMSRKLLTPAFHFKILEQFFPIMKRNANIFIHSLEEEMIRNKGIIKDYSTHALSCALNVICEAAMGIQLDHKSSQDVRFVEDMGHLGDFLVTRSLFPWLYPEFIFLRTKLGRDFKRAVDNANSLTSEILKDRKQEIVAGISNEGERSEEERKREPFLDTLIRQHLEHPEHFTEENVHEEVSTFISAGYETTGWSVTWATYLVGHHPEVQDKVQEELDALFGGRTDTDLSMDELKNQLPYTTAVLNEARRLIPTVPFISRRLEKTTNFGKYVVPAGVTVGISVIGIHKDRNHWPEPDRFKPERFLGSKRHPYSFIPFSAGPRNCIGQKYAMMEERALMSKIFYKFRVTSLVPLDDEIFGASLVTKSTVPIRMKLELRH